MTKRPASFVRIFGPAGMSGAVSGAVLAFALALGGCVQTWDRLGDRIAEAVMPTPQAEAKPEISAIEIAAIPDLADMQTASGGDTGRQAAVSHIERLGDDVLATLEISLLETDDRQEFFREILARDLDIELISRFVLGRYHKTATADQLDRYTKVFSDFLVQTYATRLGGLRIIRFKVQGARAIGDDDFLVHSSVDHGARKPVRADWRVRESGDGFKIIDLSVAGVSMALMLRQEFASIVRKQGIDGLIALLQDRTV